MILADSRQFAIRRSLLPVLSTFFYKIFTHPEQTSCLTIESLYVIIHVIMAISSEAK